MISAQCSECQSDEIHTSAVNGGSDCDSFKVDQMPRHLISDAHEWINEIPTVPFFYQAKPQPRERARDNQRGKEDPVELDSSPTL